MSFRHTASFLEESRTVARESSRYFQLYCALTPALEPSTEANDQGGKDERGDTASDEEMRFLAGAFPFVKIEPPASAENNDARHVQGPTGKTEFAHLRLAHRVKEKLQIPACARERREKVIRKHGDTLCR